MGWFLRPHRDSCGEGTVSGQGRKVALGRDPGRVTISRREQRGGRWPAGRGWGQVPPTVWGLLLPWPWQMCPLNALSLHKGEPRKKVPGGRKKGDLSTRLWCSGPRPPAVGGLLPACPCPGSPPQGLGSSWCQEGKWRVGGQVPAHCPGLQQALPGLGPEASPASSPPSLRALSPPPPPSTVPCRMAWPPRLAARHRAPRVFQYTAGAQ